MFPVIQSLVRQDVKESSNGDEDNGPTRCSHVETATPSTLSNETFGELRDANSLLGNMAAIHERFAEDGLSASAWTTWIRIRCWRHAGS